MAEIKGSFWGFVLLGLSHQTLQFRPKAGKEKKILKPYQAVETFRCESCDLTVLDHRN